MNKQLKICIICVYWGELPNWFPCFFKSCKLNSDIDFKIFIDQNIPDFIGDNIKYSHLTLKQFNSLASQKLGLNVSFKNPYKICDFKPVFGKIFEDYLTTYDFWGYCDMDIIFGPIRNFISNIILTRYDIISTYYGFLSGPFCLYRNTKYVNDLFRSSVDYESILENERNLGFDENIRRKELEGFSTHKMKILFFYLLNVVPRPFLLFHYYELRYQFHWFYKTYMLKYNKPRDMTEVVWDAAKRKTIKLFHKELVSSANRYNRNGKFAWNIIHNMSCMLDTKRNKHIFAFHIRGSQISRNFNVEKSYSKSAILITERGISNL